MVKYMIIGFCAILPFFLPLTPCLCMNFYDTCKALALVLFFDGLYFCVILFCRTLYAKEMHVNSCVI